MMTTGSVRGKCDARQSGQRRTQPADATRVGDPHWAQKRCRACQSISERASARIAASPVGIVGARVRTSISSVSMSGAVLAPLASIAKCARPSSSMPSRIRMAPASICPRHEAAGCQSSAGFAGPRTSGFRSRRARSRVPGSASSAAIHLCHSGGR